jgi:hypothetical protein
MTLLAQRTRRFARDDAGGSLVLETIIMLPLLLWALMAMITYWDAFRSINRLEKASFALADTLSRQSEPMPVASVAEWNNVVTYMLSHDQVAQVRVSSYQWVNSRNRFEVRWSRSSDPLRPALTTTTLQPLAGMIPLMADTEFGVLTETWVDYQPRLEVPFMNVIGVQPTTLSKFIPTPTRGSPLCLVGMPATQCTGSS